VQHSSRLGYYVISLGIALQVLGLAGDSWSRDPASTNEAFLAMSNPSHVLMLLGLVTIVFGTMLGFLGLSQELSAAPAKEARLLPALPLVLLVGVSLGSATFAYQTGNAATGSQEPATPQVSSQPGPNDCPDGTFWHPDMGHCMIVSTPVAGGTPGTPICPTDYAWSASEARCVAQTSSLDPSVAPSCPASTFWHPDMGHCMSTECPPSSEWDATLLLCRQLLAPGQTPDPAATPICPAGSFWHPVMVHCMSTVCPAGYEWNATLLACSPIVAPGETPGPAPTPSCPANTFWHPVMAHCMSTVCPGGFEWSWDILNCVQTSAPTPTLPPPTATPVPTATPDTRCPPGYVWSPGEGHCESTTCPPGLVFDWEDFHCELPEITPTPTPQEPPVTPTPSCPDGYFWHPDMGHCMSNTCPPGLVFNPDTLYCELPSTPPPTAGPTATPTPSCPDGYFWHPDMGHCMSNTCPPGLVFDPVTLYCALPTPTAGGSSRWL
jgi:hypothetical protein